MFPILFHVGSVPIHAYGFFFALAYIACVFVAQLMAKQANLEPRYFLNICFLSIISGLIGARLFFVWTQKDYFLDHPQEIWQLWQGGMVFYGGFILALLVDIAYIFWRRLPLLQSLDILAVAMASAQALGRIGCLGAGCCHGSLCDLPWAIRLDNELVEPKLRGLAIHPTQIYESLATALLALGLYFFWRQKKPQDGTICFAYLTGYAFIRFILEIFRGDSVRGFVFGGSLSTSQAIALIIGLPCALILATRFIRRARSGGFTT